MEKVMKKAITRSAFFIVLACMIPLTGLSASALSNGLKEWDPRSFQGTIMEVGPDYIVVAEKYVYLLNTSQGGKEIKTRIMDGNGIEIEKQALKVGKKAFVKGGMAYDDKRTTDVLLATEVYILKKPLDLKNNEGQRKKFYERSKPW
jgi:hypothetical protein